MKKLLSVTMSIVIMLSCMIFTVPAQAATQIKENQTVEVVFQRNTSLKQKSHIIIKNMAKPVFSTEVIGVHRHIVLKRVQKSQ